jgi:N-methylhydantoinase A
LAERVEADGTVSRPLDLVALEDAARELKAADVETVAVCFVNSFRNATHEQQAVAVLRQHFEFVTCSSEVLNEIREFERFSAAAMNAYVMPTMARYVRRLTEAVRDRAPGVAFYTMASNGGLLSTELVCSHPVRTILSGPAAGVAATVLVSTVTGVDKIITYDMGGTSTDVAMVAGGRFPLRRETLLDGLVIRVPQLDIETIGAGGGSIASLDAGGSLQVGPASAGASPGPACYGRGGVNPTVTDANVVLGRLGDHQELGGSLRINKAAALQAIEPLARQAGLEPARMAESIVRLAVAKMAAAVYEVSVARGHDPREFSLLCYGGAGPLHACLVADEVGIPQVIVPPVPGAFSAFGALCSNLTKDRVATVLAVLGDESLAQAWTHAHRFEDEMRQEFEREGLKTDTFQAEWQLDMRYSGQAHEITVIVPARSSVVDVAEYFGRDFEREYGRRDVDRLPELVNVRVVGRIPIEMPRLQQPDASGSGASDQVRKLVLDGCEVECPVWRREDLSPRSALRGPAVIEEMSATTYVPPGWFVRVGPIGELRATRA